MLDRVDFTNANLKGAKFHNAVVTGVVFDKADLSGTSFDEALIGNEDAKHLQVTIWKLFAICQLVTAVETENEHISCRCLNPTLSGDSRAEVGCRK